MIVTAAAGRANALIRTKGRPGGTDQPLDFLQLSSSNTADTTTSLRLQRLRLIGIIGRRAELLAALAWGEAA